MTDDDQLFRTELREGETGVLEVDESGGYVGDGGDDEIEGGGGWMNAKRVEPARQILLVKRKGDPSSQKSVFLYTVDVKAVCQNRARVSRVPRGAHQGRRTSIHSTHNQLGGITASKLPYGLTSVRWKQAPGLLKGLMDALCPRRDGQQNKAGRKVRSSLEVAPPMWKSARPNRKEGGRGSKIYFG